MKTVDTVIRLENLIKSGQDLSNVCKGRFSTYLMHDERNYCFLGKSSIPINCSKMYNYSNFPHACLYTQDLMKKEPYLKVDENIGDC